MTPVLADDGEIPDGIEEVRIKYALSERAMKALLEILRLKLDVSLVTSINELLHASGAASVFLHTACSTCHVLMRAPF